MRVVVGMVGRGDCGGVGGAGGGPMITTRTKIIAWEIQYYK